MSTSNTHPPTTHNPFTQFLNEFFSFNDADKAVILMAAIFGPFIWHYFLASIGPLYPPLAPRHESEAGDPRAGGPGNIDWEFGANIPYNDPFIPVADSCSDDDYCPCCGRSIVESTDYDSCDAECSDMEYGCGTETGDSWGRGRDGEWCSD